MILNSKLISIVKNVRFLRLIFLQSILVDTNAIKTKDGDSFDKEIIPLEESGGLSFGLVEELKDVKYYKGSSKILLLT